MLSLESTFSGRVFITSHRLKSASKAPKLIVRGMSKDGDGKRHVVVCGAGVVGSCTAYYLAKMGLKVTVIERNHVACAASGKAGGFLALDWSSGNVGKLANMSYELHEKLCEELGVDYGYRKVDTLSMSVSELSTPSSHSPQGLPSWINGSVRGTKVIGSPKSTAQVHPKMFTEAILSAAREKFGVSLRIGKVQGVQVKEMTDDRWRKVTGVIVEGDVVLADAVVVAMGPWSSQVKLVGQLTSITGLKANSVVLRPENPSLVSAHMLFLHYVTKDGKSHEPEVYPRPNGEVYVCGMSEEVQVPEDPADIRPSVGASEALCQVAATVSSHLAGAECTAEQACFLPCSEDGVPVIGPIPGVEGAYVATGHSCWGILMAPGTGLAMAELIAEGKASCVDISGFSPERFLRNL